MILNRKVFLYLLSTLAYFLERKYIQSDTMDELTEIPKREIPSTKEKIPVLGFGTWRVFDLPVTLANLERLFEVWNVFQMHGGRLIDSSPMYGNAESFIGSLFEKYGKDDTFFATKVWTSGKQEGIKQIESSFQKMKTKKIDLFQIHNLVDVNTQLKSLRELKEKGLIRYIGITHYLPSYFETMEALIKKEKLDFIQIPYSISLRDAENRILPLAKDKGVAVLINRPFEGGDLFKDFLKKPIDPRLLSIGIHSWAELFIRFLVANSNLTCILFASSNPNHVVENMNATKKPILNKQELELAYKVFQEVSLS